MRARRLESAATAGGRGAGGGATAQATRPQPESAPALRPAAKAVYGLGDHTVNAALAALSMHYLFFLTEVVELRPALAGGVPWVGRIVDALTDPIMGRISDRTSWRQGRRRPYFLIGALPFGLAFALLWLDVPIESQLGRFLYYAGAYVFFSVAVTVLSVPYLALIPEMAFDYQERTNLNSFRAAGAMLGAVVAVGLRSLAQQAGGGAAGFAAAGAAFGVWLAVPWLAVWAVSWERPGFRRPVHTGLATALRDLFRHRAYRVVATLFLFSRIAVDLVLAMLIFYFEYWMRRPGDFEWSMFLLLASVLLALPVWLRISSRTDKRTLFLAGAAAWVAVQLAFLAANPDWPRWLVLALACWAGLAYAAIEVMPWSMLGDVVDEDELQSGERREGLYAGSFMFLRKLGGPSGVLLAGVVLDATGFGRSEPPPEAAIGAIRGLTALAPLAFVALAAWAASGYPLSRAAHARILQALAARRSGSRATSPDSDSAS